LLVVGFATGAYQANCYLLATGPGAGCVIVDPGEGVVGALDAALREHALTPAAILATHGHFDHVASATEVAEEHGVTVRMHPADAGLLGESVHCVPLAEETLTLAGLEITVEAAPGHTPGSVVFRLGSAEGGLLAITGDTLFAGSIGRTDREGGDAEDLARSLRSKVLTLPDETVVLPGHGPATTIGRERAANPFLALSPNSPH
jgi:glyoxylase-like metal-dependent hydrolase (beta-lactamase superfamily II)